MSSTKYFKELNAAERKQFFDSFDVVFCDCDGVIWTLAGNLIAGSIAAIDYLQREGKQVTFVTNNSIFAVDELVGRFSRAQLSIDKSQIIHPAQSICDYLQSIKFDGLIYCLATTPFRQLLTDAGFQLVPEQNPVFEALNNFSDAVYANEPVRAVILDVDLNLTVAKLMRARVHLHDEQCLFIAGAYDVSVWFGRHNNIGPGAFVAMLAQSVGRQPMELGKPGEALRHLLQQRHAQCPPERVLFIGDSPTSDIAFARQSGYQTLLVTLDTDLPAEAAQQPDYVVDSLADLLA